MFSAVKAWPKPLPDLHIQQIRPLISVNSEPASRWRLFFNSLAQSFRLMVGVRDYQTYLRHMQQHHPHKVPMTARDFHRYCLDARFPSKPGAIGKCPC